MTATRGTLNTTVPARSRANSNAVIHAHAHHLFPASRNLCTADYALPILMYISFHFNLTNIVGGILALLWCCFLLLPLVPLSETSWQAHATLSKFTTASDFFDRKESKDQGLANIFARGVLVPVTDQNFTYFLDTILPCLPRTYRLSNCLSIQHHTTLDPINVTQQSSSTVNLVLPQPGAARNSTVDIKYVIIMSSKLFS